MGSGLKVAITSMLLKILDILAGAPYSRVLLKAMPDETTLNLDDVKNSAISKIIGQLCVLIALKPKNRELVVEKKINLICNNRKMRLSVNIAEYNQASWYFGFIDDFDKFFDLFVQHKGGTFIDIGANIGVMSLAGSTLFDRVISFEPTPSTYERLKNNIALSGVSNVKAEKIALSEKNGTAVFYESTVHIGMNTLSQLPDIPQNKNEWRAISVETATLDEYVKKNGITDVRFIKIDVEQHEPEVLKGAAEVLEKYKPALLVETIDAAMLDLVRNQLPPCYVRHQFITPIDSFFATQGE